MAPKRNHHYVPRFYLSGFVDPQTPRGQTPFLWVRDVQSGRIYRRAPNKVAAQSGFYAIERDGDIDYESVENELSDIESRAAIALRRYLVGPAGDRGPIRPELADFLAWLAVRVPWFQRAANEAFAEYLTGASRSQNDDLDDPTFQVALAHRSTGAMHRERPASAAQLVATGEWVPVLDQNQWIDAMRVQQWYLRFRHFPLLQWILLTSPSGKFFITSDRPVVWFIPGRGYADSPAALKDPAVQLSVPLDAHHAFLALGSPPARHMVVAPEEINERTAYHAERFIASPHADFGSAR